jgi:UDP-glucuronate 4-epimerase
MSVLVTGGAGFIGSHFIERLLAETDLRIVCLDNFNDYYPSALKRANVAGFAGNSRVVMAQADFCDAPAMERLFASHAVRQVVHLGAYAGVHPSIDNPFIYQSTNVGGTLSLLEAARRHPVERFLLASSSTVYGASAVPPFVEDAPLGTPLSPYGASKQAAEIMGATYRELHRVPVASLRFFSVYGPRVRPDLAVSVFTRAIAAGRPVPLFGDGSIRRDFTHVNDVTAGTLAALVRPGVVGLAFNLGHNEPIAMRTVIDTIARALRREAAIEFLPPKAGDMPATCADLTRSRSVLGYEPKVAFDEGIGDTVRWFQQQGMA